MEKKKISARIIADSQNEYGNRLTTFVLTFPRIVLAEFNTHRVISRNSASSRAIPFEKMVKMVQEDPFIPINWMKDHKGMQGTEYFKDEEELPRDMWLQARDEAVSCAKYLSNLGLTKQICNRLLEPFMWHTVIATASEWQNFFALRAHDQAEIHIQELAYKMLDEYNANTPKVLKAGEWHIPFGDKIDVQRMIDGEAFSNEHDGFAFGLSGDIEYYIEKFKVKIATARCARVSYLNFEGKDDYEADIKLHDTLLSSGHMSPFEHCARAMTEREFEASDVHCLTNNITEELPEYSLGWSGNFEGFIQYRKMIKNESKTDNRVISKQI